MFSSVRGFRDILGNSWDIFHFIESKALEVFELYGYGGIELPILEYKEVFSRSLGETSDVVNKEMYTFLDRNEEELTLRPEGTAGVARALLSNRLDQDLPQKFFYMGPMFRYERPQKGRYRQFYQLGLEHFSSMKNPYIDVEIILIAARILHQLGIKNYNLEINSLGNLKERKRFNEALFDYFSKFKNELSKDSQDRLNRNPLRILDSKDSKDKAIVEGAPILKDFLEKETLGFFETICKGLDDFDIKFKINPLLVRGLDYYRDTTFEFKNDDLGAQNAFVAGGRYDGLTEILGGDSIPSIGWSMGMDRLMLLLEKNFRRDLSKIMVVPFDQNFYPYSLEIAEILRSSGIACEISLKGKLAKDLKYASKKEVNIVLLVGSEELEQQTVSIKFMKEERANQKVPKDELCQCIKKLIKH